MGGQPAGNPGKGAVTAQKAEGWGEVEVEGPRKLHQKEIGQGADVPVGTLPLFLQLPD